MGKRDIKVWRVCSQDMIGQIRETEQGRDKILESFCMLSTQHSAQYQQELKTRGNDWVNKELTFILRVLGIYTIPKGLHLGKKIFKVWVQRTIWIRRVEMNGGEIRQGIPAISHERWDDPQTQGQLKNSIRAISQMKWCSLLNNRIQSGESSKLKGFSRIMSWVTEYLVPSSG